MNRRRFLGTAAVGAWGVCLRGEPVVSPSLESAGSLIRTPLALMAPRPDGFDAAWGVNQLSRGRIEWRSDDGRTGLAGTDPFGFVPQGDAVLRVRVSNLRPGTRYEVRSVTTTAENKLTETSPWKPFRTLDPTARSTKFVVWNDTHVNNQTIRQLDRATPEADFLLWNGDTCNDWTAEDLLVPTLLCPGGCDVTHGRPLFLVWGNHDVRGKYAFQVPALVTTPTHRPFYAFRCGPVAVICLHTGEDKPDGHPSFGGRVAFDSLRQEQAAWLAETIARPEISGAAYRIVFCHIPLRWLDETPPDYAKAGFDHYSRRSREAWHHALVRWQAQVVISGHTHHDAWLPASADFPYGQLVGGGPQPNSATWIEANAGPDGLHLQMHDLEGKIRHEVRLGPIT